MAEVGCAGILVADTFRGPVKELPGEGRLLAVDAMPSRGGGGGVSRDPYARGGPGNK